VFTPVQTRRTFEEAADQIAEKVRAGELRTGDRLPGERSLAAQMEISRPTLREAVKVLVDAGVLEVRRGPGGGMYVATDVVPTDLVRHSASLRLAEIAAVLEARRLLEPQVALLAAERAGEEDFAAMERSIEAMRRIVDGGWHQRHALARAAGNPTVETLIRILFRQLEIARDMAMHVPLVPEWTIGIHERTLAALRSGEADEIEAVMDEHLGQLERTYEGEPDRVVR
jgi:GntR family transcriptional repressor for pyruvate dehydrogenase complex